MLRELEQACGTACRCRCRRFPTRPARIARRWIRAGADRGSGRRTRRTARDRSRAQLSRNAARRPSTAGPAIRKCVSRHCVSLSALPSHSSAMPTPPVKPIASSTIMTLRCVRWLIWLSRKRRSGRNQRNDDAGSLHRVDQAIARSGATPGVEQDPHPHTVPGALGERVRELAADAPFPVDEREEVDRVVGLLDRVEHRGKDLVAVAQHVDAVAFGRGNADHAFDRRGRRHAVPRPTSPARRAPTLVTPRRAPVRGARPLVRLGVFDLLCVLRLAGAGADRFELGGDRAAEQHRDRREQRPQQAARPCRPAVRRSARTTCSSRRTRPGRRSRRANRRPRRPRRTPAMTVPVGAGAGDQRKSIVIASVDEHHAGRPPNHLPSVVQGGVVDRVADRLPERQQRERGQRQRARRTVRASARPYFCTVGRSCSTP